MTGPRTTEAIEKLVADPAAHFSSPGDVLVAPLSLATKRRVLESWEVDARRLEDSASENMAGGERSRLAAVLEARRRLEQTARAT